MDSRKELPRDPDEILYAPAPESVEVIQSTVKAKLGHLTGIAIDAVLRRLYICASDQGCIYYLDLATQETHKYAGTGHPGFLDGPALQARFDQPRSIGVDEDHNLYIADAANSCIRCIFYSTQQVATIAGQARSSGFTNGVAVLARFAWPAGICYNRLAKCLYVSDFQNGAIRVLTRKSLSDPWEVDTLLNNQGGNGLVSIQTPWGLSMDYTNNRLIIPDTSARRVFAFPLDTVRPLAHPTVALLTFPQPKDYTQLAVLGGSSYGGFKDHEVAQEGKISYAAHSCVDRLGNVFFTDSDSAQSLRIITTDSRLCSVARRLQWPSGTAFDEDTGDVFVSEYRGDRILRIVGASVGSCGRNEINFDLAPMKCAEGEGASDYQMQFAGRSWRLHKLLVESRCRTNTAQLDEELKRMAAAKVPVECIEALVDFLYLDTLPIKPLEFLTGTSYVMHCLGLNEPSICLLERARLMASASIPWQVVADTLQRIAEWKFNALSAVVLRALVHRSDLGPLHALIAHHPGANTALTALIPQVEVERARSIAYREAMTWTGSLSADLSVLYRNRNSTGDFTIALDSQKVSVHKVVLMGRWEYFRALVSAGLKEAKLATLSLPGVGKPQGLSYSAVKGLVKYFYTNKPKIKSKLDRQLILEAAQLYCLLPPEEDSEAEFIHHVLIEYCNTDTK